jgi:PqqA peptide cyclase
MKEPCSSCEHREQDLGGCRCQAFMLAQDPAAADPVCSKSPLHHVVTDAVTQAEVQVAKAVQHHPLVFRSAAESKRLAAASGLGSP